MRHLVIRPPNDLLAVIAGVQPRIWISPTSKQFGASDQRLRQINGIGHDKRKSDTVPVPDEMLDHGGLIALNQAIPSNPGTLEMRRVYGEDVAFILSCGEPHPGVLRVGRRMRPPVHPDGPISLCDLAEHLN